MPSIIHRQAPPQDRDGLVDCPGFGAGCAEGEHRGAVRRVVGGVGEHLGRPHAPRLLRLRRGRVHGRPPPRTDPDDRGGARLRRRPVRCVPPGSFCPEPDAVAWSPGGGFICYPISDVGWDELRAKPAACFLGDKKNGTRHEACRLFVV
jgi:hypothetical protein